MICLAPKLSLTKSMAKRIACSTSGNAALTSAPFKLTNAVGDGSWLSTAAVHRIYKLVVIPDVLESKVAELVGECLEAFL